VAWKTPPAVVRVAVAAALTLALASCGGGSTAGPAPAPGAARTAVQPAAPAPSPATSTAPAPVTATTPAAPRATTPAPAPRTASRPASGRSRAAGGAAAPTAGDPSAAARDLPPAPAAPTAQPPAQPATATLDERANLILVRRVSPSHYFQQGTVLGTYDGTMAAEARITSKGVLVRFTATLPGGTLSGRALAVAILDSTTWPGLRGTAVVTGGTGRFAGLHGRRLKVTGRAKPDASRAHVRLAGTVLRG
jgi:hypothetical protein